MLINEFENRDGLPLSVLVEALWHYSVLYYFHLKFCSAKITALRQPGVLE